MENQLKFELETSEKLQSLAAEGWSVVERFKLCSHQTPFSTPKLLKKFSKNNVRELIELAFPSSCIQLIQAGWNTRLRDAVKNGNGTKNGVKVSKKTASLKKELSITETYNLLGIILQLCLTQKSDMAECLKEVYERWEGLPSRSRVRLTLPQLGLENRQFDLLLEKLGDTNAKLVQPGLVSVVDETSIPWLGRSQQQVDREGKVLSGGNKFSKSSTEDLPVVVVIPSKPHPVSILMHGDVVKLPASKRSFTMRFTLRHPGASTSFSEHMNRLLQASPLRGNTHIWVADSAYGNNRAIEGYQRMGKKVVLSIRKDFLGDTRKLLDEYCTKGGSISLSKSTPPFFLSMTPVKEKDEKVTNKFLITNAAEVLQSKDLPDLKEEEISDTITLKGIRGVNKGADSKQDLHEFTVDILKHICESIGLSKSGSKEKLVDKIFFRKSKAEYSDNQVIALNMLRESQSDDSNQLQQIYKEQFNLEDTFNECLLEFLPKFTVTNWRTKVLIGVILSQIVNARALLEERQKGKKIKLRKFLNQVSEYWIQKA